MFNLSELITIRDALSTKITTMSDAQAITVRKDIIELREENLKKVVILYKRVSNQVDTAAHFADANGGGYEAI